MISKSSNVSLAHLLNSIILSSKAVCHVLNKNRFLMVKNVWNVGLIRNTTKLPSSVMIAIMEGSIILQANNVNALIHFFIIMVQLVLNVSIQNTIISTKISAWSVQRIKFIILNSKNASFVLKTILTLMGLDALFAPRTLFGILHQKSVRLAKEDRS